MTYSIAIENNIQAIRAAHKEGAAIRAAKLAAKKVAVVATTDKFLTKEDLINACQVMDLDTILCESYRRTTNHRGYAVEVALARFIGTTFGQQYHAIANGEAQAENPQWFKQLYTDLAWSSSDITPGAILQALI